MAIAWDDSLLVGFEEIDNQHKSIIRRFEELSEAVQQGKSDEIIEEMSVFLFQYAQLHFSAEDRLMVEHNYPKIDLQRFEHGEFTRNANELKKSLERQGASRELAVATVRNMLRWIISHIRNHDMEMGAFVRESVALRKKYEH